MKLKEWLKKDNFIFKDLILIIIRNQTNKRDFWFMLFGAILTVLISVLIVLFVEYMTHYLLLIGRLL